MRNLLFLLATFAFQVHADWDALAIFHRPEKVLVRIDEWNPAPANAPLERWMALFPTQVRVTYESTAEGVSMTCTRAPEGRTCTFRFTPGTAVEISPKRIESYIPAARLLPLGFTGDPVDVSLLNSNGDRFRIWSDGGNVRLSGSKR